MYDRPSVEPSVLRAMEAAVLFCIITFWAPLALFVYWVFIR